MTNYVICPECEKRADLMPIRKPLENDISTTLANITAASTMVGDSYSSTIKSFKCANPKCWVSKVELRWS